MSGGQILEGDVKFFVKRNVSMIPSKVPYSSTEVGVNSENKRQDVGLQHLYEKNIEISVWLSLTACWERDHHQPLSPVMML